MLEFIYGLFVWIIVPGIILVMFILSMIVVARVVDLEPKISARAGFWAGMLIFVVFVVSQLRLTQQINFSNILNLPPFDLTSLIYFVTGIIFGFILLRAIVSWIPTRFVGILTLFLSATSSVAFFSYFFVQSIRVIAIFSTLGIVFGILLHIVFFPKSAWVLIASGRAILKVFPKAFYTSQNCIYIQGMRYWQCQAALLNGRYAQSELDWSVTSVGIPGVTFRPSSGKIPPGKQILVEIHVPDDGRAIPTTFSFVGPVNTVNVPWINQ